MDIYELLSVGMIILLGLLGGKLSHHFKIPSVTGYMLTGLIFGPSVLGLISSSTLQDIHIINEIALGLILFAIGGEVEIQHLKAMGKRVILIALAESFGAFTLVFLVLPAPTWHRRKRRPFRPYPTTWAWRCCRRQGWRLGW